MPPASYRCDPAELHDRSGPRRATVLARCPSDALGGVEQQIIADGPAGVFLTGHTTVGTAALARQTAELQRVATAASGGSGLFLATDQRAAMSGLEV